MKSNLCNGKKESVIFANQTLPSNESILTQFQKEIYRKTILNSILVPNMGKPTMDLYNQANIGRT